jgi:hypothetical protein
MPALLEATVAPLRAGICSCLCSPLFPGLCRRCRKRNPPRARADLGVTLDACGDAEWWRREASDFTPGEVEGPEGHWMGPEYEDDDEDSSEEEEEDDDGDAEGPFSGRAEPVR